jgi:hypothetical protein
MVGDLQRLVVYGQKGWSAPQAVPPEVMAAYEGLVAAGYTKRLLAADSAPSPSSVRRHRIS